jgi:hypothetical protein
MEYYNMKEAKEIDFAIDYLKEIRAKYIDEIRAKEKELGKGVITDVVNNLASGIVTLENKEIDRLKKRLAEL